MTTTIIVAGMACGHSEQTVEEARRGASGVTDAAADREDQRAGVDGDADGTALVGGGTERPGTQESSKRPSAGRSRDSFQRKVQYGGSADRRL